MTPNDVNQILQQLQARGFLTPDQVPRILAEAQQTGGDLLTTIQNKRIVSEEELAKMTAAIFGMPYVNLIDQEIPADVLHVLSQQVAENYQVIPFAHANQELSVAMVDPHDFKAIQALDFIARRDHVRMNYFLTSKASLRAVLRQYANLSKEVVQALQASTASSLDAGGDVSGFEAEEVDAQAVQTAPVSKIVAVILRYAVEGSASDVHIEPSEQGTRVRYRVDGLLHTSLQLPKNVHNSLVARIKVLANLKLDETRLPQDGRFHMTIEGREVDFRVSTLPLIGQEKVVLRILDTVTGLRSLQELGFADRNLQIIQDHLKRPHGMVLITGPTGSGKSTTLYALLQILNEESSNIITLEDPVEYSIPGISQSQVHPEIGLTFARGLRSILRQDPDIIMVGEVRDNETAELAIHAALTGHMLLSTLHTNDAIGAIPRLVDMKIEPFLISSAMNVIISQRLVRRICEHCVEPSTIPDAMQQTIIDELTQVPAGSLPPDIVLTAPLQVSKGKGCPRCDDTGYHGRVAISEVVENTDQLREIVASGQFNQAGVEEELRRQGMMTIKQDGFIKTLRGQTTVEEIWTATRE